MTGSTGFDRARHLWLAVIGLMHPVLLMHMHQLLPLLVEARPWTAEVELLRDLIPTIFAATLAWLAFQRFDTHAGVTVFPRRWSDVGTLLLVVFGIRFAITLVWLATESPEQLIELDRQWLHPYIEWDGSLRVSWILASCIVGAIGEELIYRALLLRALEGYVGPWPALLAQALVFELVHVFTYGHGFRGGVWFAVALIYGYAFQRTRSVAVPVLMHASLNIVFLVGMGLMVR